MDRLSAMEAFVRVVDTGSFSVAARQLDIGQPAASKAVSQLETWLGVRLLLRSTRSVRPTEAGRGFYVRARRAIEEADQAVASARSSANGLTGRIRISASVCFARIHIVPRLPEFLKLHPELSIDLLLEDRNVDLVEEGVDVALRMGSLEDSTLTARKVGDCRRLVLATPAYLAAHVEPQCPEDLLRHEVVVYTRDGGGESWGFHKGEAHTRINVQGRLRVSAAEGLREAVLADLGMAIVSEWTFTPELASGRVRETLTDWQLPRQSLWAVFPSGRMASAKAREFVTFVENCLRLPRTAETSLRLVGGKAAGAANHASVA